jgi:hypothetical protein
MAMRFKISDGKTMLKWMLEKKDGTMWTRFIWQRIGTGGRLL